MQNEKMNLECFRFGFSFFQGRICLKEKWKKGRKRDSFFSRKIPKRPGIGNAFLGYVRVSDENGENNDFL